MATGEIYEQAALRMLEAARANQPLKPVLNAHCPWIKTQLRKTSRYPGLVGLWGRSLNVDEKANAVIVEPPLLKLIGELANQPLRGRIVHAGWTHTYGYLFSLIDTPYGKKRDRWIKPDLDEGFGFDVPTLRDEPEAGTLLLNLTFCLAQIAFRNDSAELLERIRQESMGGVAPSVREYPYDELAINRVVEEIVVPDGRREGTRIELWTDLVDLPRPGGAETLLVYSVWNGARLGPQLITAFPATSESVAELFSAESLGDKVEIRSQYNAYVEGLSGRSLVGRRFPAE